MGHRLPPAPEGLVPRDPAHAADGSTAPAPARFAARLGRWTAFVLLGAATSLHAQEIGRVDVRVNYVYATQFGFGGYDVGGLRANVYSLPIGLGFDDVLGSWDLQVDLPVTYGRFRFREDVVLQSGERVSVRNETNTLAAEPQLRLDIPMPWLPGLRVSPLGGFGFGTTFSSDGSIERDGVVESLSSDEDAFYTYQIGIATVYEHRWRKFLFAFGNAFVYAGNATFDGDAEDVVEGYGTFRTGVEARHPLGFRIADFVPDGGVFFVYHLFTPNLEFTQVGRNALEIDEIFEVGVTVGATELSRIGWLPRFLNRAVNKFSVGIGYQTGDGLDGFRLSFGYPF